MENEKPRFEYWQNRSCATAEGGTENRTTSPARKNRPDPKPSFKPAIVYPNNRIMLGSDPTSPNCNPRFPPRKNSQSITAVSVVKILVSDIQSFGLDSSFWFLVSGL